MSHPGADDAPIRLLLVEDDEDDYLLTRELLDAIGHTRYTLEWASDPDAALAIMGQARHDIYLVDYQLGRRTGIELMQAARERGCSGPILVLTGHVDLRTDVRAMEAGAMDYLAKSELTSALLERSLRYAIERRRIEAELAEMRRRVADSGEAERLRLARELHDGPLQDLIGTHMQLGRLADAPDAESLGDMRRIVEASLVGAIDHLRRICSDLRPPALAPFGLERAIRSHAKRFQQANEGLQVTLELDADGRALPEATRMAVFRIYQQALANVARHAAAGKVDVRFKLNEDSVLLEVADDGTGFRVPRRWIHLAQQGRFGLLGAFERAESIGGRLEVTSGPATGTRLRVVAPRRVAPGPVAADEERSDG